MNQKLQSMLVACAVFVISTGAITYGALTANQPDQPVQQVQSKPQTPKTAPSSKPSPKPVKLTKSQLTEKLGTELPTITNVMTTAYPKIATDYVIENAQLYEEGKWFGALLRYKGTDTNNRDTLRVLLQKKDGLWVMRTTPPAPLLSAKKYPYVPRSVLKALNKPVSLP